MTEDAANAPWTCQYKGCQSTPTQLEALRVRRPEGFPHDEDPNVRVCTVCRRLSLKEQMVTEEESLDAAFIAGIKEELSAIEENEQNIQALSQVFRYYAKHAKQLSQVLHGFATQQCFPWELIHAMHLVDDILLMDNTGRFKGELQEKMQAIVVHAFRKVQSDLEKREVARMLHTWGELKIFTSAVLEAIRGAIRGCSAAAGQILDEVAAEDEEDEPEGSPVAGQDEATAGVPGAGVAAPAPKPKRQKVDPRDAREAAAQQAKKAEAAKAAVERVKALVDRILATSVEKPFEILGISKEGAGGHDIRTAYRKIALSIHPDKNPAEVQARCREAWTKLQASREQAEKDLHAQPKDELMKQGDTRSAATAACAAATVDASFKCKYPGCDLPPCKQCANGCCTRNITHCHNSARAKGGLQCFFHPPPRAWARNA